MQSHDLVKKIRIVGIDPVVSASRIGVIPAGFQVTFNAKTKPDDIQYYNRISWRVNGALVGLGNEIKIAFHDPGWKAGQAFVGLSGSVIDEQGTLFEVIGETKGETTKPEALNLAEKYVKEKSTALKAAVDNCTGFVDKHGEKWEEYLPLNVTMNSRRAIHMGLICRGNFRLSNESYYEPIPSNIKGWVFSPLSLLADDLRVCAGSKLYSGPSP